MERKLAVHPTAVSSAAERLALHRALHDVSELVELETDPVVSVAICYVYRSGAIGHQFTNTTGGNLNTLLGAMTRQHTHLALRCCELPCKDENTTPIPPTTQA